MTLLAKIEELREMEKKATHAPWKWTRDRTCADSYGSLFGDDGAVISTCCDDCRGDDDIVKNEADREFIPALRNIAPDLLAALDFRQGDAFTLEGAQNLLFQMGVSKTSIIAECMSRMIGMARKMEDEER